MSIIHITKLKIETISPISICSTDKDANDNCQLALDLNELPCIPATSIAGVWRHFVMNTNASLLGWFGGKKENNLQGNKSDLGRSKLIIYDGCLLVSDEAYDNYTDENKIKRPQISYKDRVAINARGVAKDKSKFSQLVLDKGATFLVTLKWIEENNENSALLEEQWNELLSYWQDKQFSFGSNRRNGLGQIKVVGVEEKKFDLKHGFQQAKMMQEYLSAKFTQENSFKLVKIREEQKSVENLVTLNLKGLSSWRLEILKSESATKDITSKPQYTLLDASSLKGALIHRIKYNYNLVQKNYVEKVLKEIKKDDIGQDEDLYRLLNVQYDKKYEELYSLIGSGNSSTARAGKLYFYDTKIIGDSCSERIHNCIDRLTGGTIDGAIFKEVLLNKPKLELVIDIEKNFKLTASQKEALLRTIKDLENGLVPIGAGAGRGTGLFEKDGESRWFVNESYLGESTDV